MNFYDIAESNNISVFNAKIDANGYYFNVNNNPTIIINNNLSSKEEELVLAEEVAHYSVGVTPTLPFANDYYSKLIRSKNEFKAFKWLQDKLIPYDMQKYKYHTLWELAEELNIPVEFIEKTIEYRKENYNG